MRINISITSKNVENLFKLSKIKNVTQNDLINKAIEEYLGKHENAMLNQDYEKR